MSSGESLVHLDVKLGHLGKLCGGVEERVMGQPDREQHSGINGALALFSLASSLHLNILGPGYQILEKKVYLPLVLQSSQSS